MHCKQLLHNYSSSTLRICCEHLLFDVSVHLDFGEDLIPQTDMLPSTCTLAVGPTRE